MHLNHLPKRYPTLTPNAGENQRSYRAGKSRSGVPPLGHYQKRQGAASTFPATPPRNSEQTLITPYLALYHFQLIIGLFIPEG